jgi:AraC-like DNA-binding protein
MSTPSHDLTVPAWPQTLRRTPTTAGEWHLVLNQIMQPGELRMGTGNWQGAAFAARLAGGGTLAELAIPAFSALHRPKHLAPTRERETLVHIVLEGAGHLYQAGRAIPFRAGDITFRDAQLPSRADFEGTSARLIALRLPVSRWPECFPSGLNGPDIAPHDHVLTRAVHGFLSQLLTDTRDSAGLVPAAASALERTFVEMLSATRQQFQPQSSTPTAPSLRVRRRQVHSYIDAHLFDPALAPAACARALGISERYLHQVLNQHGERFSQLVLGKRLDIGAQRLRDPRFARYRISGIAWQCGFQDPAHFSRAFAARFGVAPKVWRIA